VLLDLTFTVLVPTLLVVLVAILRGRRKAVSSGEFDSDSVSFAGGVISALFTVVLAFYVVFAWQLGADIDSSTTAPAALSSFFRAFFPSSLLLVVNHVAGHGPR
jgi:hypothetical protein